jgi:hypothetical protein
MEAVLAIASVVTLVVLLWDMFITVFSGNGAGSLSKAWYRLAWRGLLAIHERRPIHRLLSLAGPFMLITSVLLWFAMLGAALFLALAALPGSVVNNLTGEAADPVQTAYFVSTTLTGLGYGDLVPSGFPWTMASTLATLGGTIIITISLSYVLAVLAAAIERKKLAQGIFGLGETVPRMAERAKLNDPGQSLMVHVLNLTSDIDHQSLKNLAYPILKYFHSPRADLSSSRAVLLLSDTFFLLGLMPEGARPPLGLLQIVDSSVARYVDLNGAHLESSSRQRTQPAQLVDAARQLGATCVGHEEFEVALDAYLPRRNLLIEICKQDGWDEK